MRHSNLINDKESVTKALCMFCMNRCGVEVLVQNSEIVKISPDRNSRTRGFTCQRLRLAALDYHNHPQRLNYPLKRMGERGEGKWQRISWDQALDEIANQLGDIKSNYGAEAISSSDGTGRTRHQWIDRFHNLIGSPNHVGINTICFAPCIGTGVTMFGWPLRHRMGLTIEKGANGSPTKSAMLIGVNPSQTTLRMWKSILDAKELGVKIIVIDPL